MIDLLLAQSPVLNSRPAYKHLILEMLPLSHFDKTDWTDGNYTRTDKTPPAVAA
jgi:hypothetical protein